MSPPGPVLATGAKQPPRVLSLASEAVIHAVRLEPLLDALVAAGTIAGWHAVDRDLASAAPPPFDRFDVALAQRNVSRTQLRFLRQTAVPFVYDIDDLLPELPSRRDRPDDGTNARIAWCLEHAAAVTTPNRRLAEELRRATAVDFLARNVILPNGLRPPLRTKAASEPIRELLWVSSDLPLIQDEAPELARTIASAAEEHGLAVTLIGRFPDAVLSAFPKARHIERLDFSDYRTFLSQRRGAMAVAPLPARSARHQPFIDGKSDIKVVDFLGHGIPAVYSDALPFRSSDLSPRPLVPNEPAAWREAIGAVVGDPGRFCGHGAVEAVRSSRAYDRLAIALGTCLQGAAGAQMALPRPSLNARLRRLEKRFRSWRDRLRRRT